MPSPVGVTLEKLGLYRPVKKTIRYLSDPQFRQREREVREDLERTRRDVGSWARLGSENADPNRLFGIVSFTNLPLHAKFHCLVAKAMQLRGYTPVVFNVSGNRFGHDYYRLFGIDRLIMWDRYVREVASADDAVQALTDSLLPIGSTVRQAIETRFHGVEVGKHALSMVCRRRVEGQLDLSDPETWRLLREQLRNAVAGVLAAQRFLDDHPMQKMLVRDAGYIPNGAIYETALGRGVDCVVYEQGQRRGTWIVKRHTPETRGLHYFSLSAPTWERILQEPWTDADDNRLEQEFAGRYRPDSTDDTRRLQSGKQLKTPEAVRAQLGLDPNKKTTVIFSHVAWDAAFFYGTCLFDDFEQWLFETVKFVAAECPELNWIVKLHPFNVFKLQRETKSEESEMRLLRSLMPLPEHVRIVHADTDINTQSLFPIVDYVLTVNGTVGMEFPCYGVPAVLAGTGRYNGRGFTIDPGSQEAYWETLRRLHTVPPLDPNARQFARRHFLALIARRQTSLEDVAPMELKRLHEAQSNVADNIRIAAQSLEEFRSSPSLRRLGDWLATSVEPDLLEPGSATQPLNDPRAH
jgi:hypothetical protein